MHWTIHICLLIWVTSTVEWKHSINISIIFYKWVSKSFFFLKLTEQPLVRGLRVSDLSRLLFFSVFTNLSTASSAVILQELNNYLLHDSIPMARCPHQTLFISCPNSATSRSLSSCWFSMPCPKHFDLEPTGQTWEYLDVSTMTLIWGFLTTVFLIFFDPIPVSLNR